MSRVAVFPCLTRLFVHFKCKRRGSIEIGSDVLMVKSITLTIVHLLFKNEIYTTVYGRSLKKLCFLYFCSAELDRFC